MITLYSNTRAILFQTNLKLSCKQWSLIEANDHSDLFWYGGLMLRGKPRDQWHLSFQMKAALPLAKTFADPRSRM